MRFKDASTDNPQRPWAAIDIAEIDDATVRLHWTDQPYHWHVNDGPERSPSRRCPTGPDRAVAGTLWLPVLGESHEWQLWCSGVNGS